MNPFDDETPHIWTASDVATKSGNSTNPFDESYNTVEPKVNGDVKSDDRAVASNPFDEKYTSNTTISNNGDCLTTARPMLDKVVSAAKRKSSLLSGQEPIDVTVLTAGERRLIIMGVSVQAARESRIQGDEELEGALVTLSALATSPGGKKLKVWAPPFQLRITGSEINSTSAKKPFVEYSVLVMPRGSDSTYLVKKRYSQFVQLNAALHSLIAPIAPSGLQFAFVDSRYQLFAPPDIEEARKDMLNAWLVGVIYEAKFMLNSAIFHHFATFFGYFENIIVDEVIRGVSVPSLFR